MPSRVENTTKKSRFCEHCDPYTLSPHHFFERLEDLFFPLKRVLILVESFTKKQFPNTFARLTRITLTYVFNILIAFKILQEIDLSVEDTNLRNRTLVILKEAHKRGLVIKSLDVFGKRKTGYFSIIINQRKIFFESFPTVEIFNIPLIDLDDKRVFKELLRKHELPYAAGKCFSQSRDGFLFAKSNGFPLVVKPKSGSLSKHTTYNIRNETELKKAIEIAQIIEREFIIEEFIQGNVYRITVVNGEVVASCLREAPNILGDGRHTVKELVDIKNKDPRRGHAHQKNFTLHKIQLDSEKAQVLLAQQGVSKETILPQGKKIYLHDKIVLSAGADIHDTTDTIHQDNISLFKNIYEICHVPVIGIDFIAKDISRSYSTERCAILEVNSLPYIDMHHYPVTGVPRNVAGHILDYCISYR